MTNLINQSENDATLFILVPSSIRLVWCGKIYLHKKNNLNNFIIKIYNFHFLYF